MSTPTACTRSVSGVVRDLLTNIFREGYHVSVDWHDGEDETIVRTHADAVAELLYTTPDGYISLQADEVFLAVRDKDDKYVGTLLLVDPGRGSDSSCEVVADYSVNLDALVPALCAYCA